MTRQELDEKYMPVSHAAMELGMTAQKVYNLLQTGKLSGICAQVGGWRVDRSSVARLKRQLATAVSGVA